MCGVKQFTAINNIILFQKNGVLCYRQSMHNCGHILVFVMLAALPLAGQSQFRFATNSGAVTVTRCIAPDGNVIVPAVFEGLPVSAIGPSAFLGCTGITSVVLPQGITRIGRMAFGLCTTLTNIDIPNTVKTLEYSPFFGCSNLLSISIPNSVANVEGMIFVNCPRLTNVTLGSGVTLLDENDFDQCPGLMTIAVDPRNPVYSSVDGVLCNKTTLLKCPRGKTGSYTVPAGVASIGAFAFASCSQLTNLVVSDNVITIFRKAFLNCNHLTAVTLGKNIRYIESNAFLGCRNLKALYFRGNAPVCQFLVFDPASQPTIYYLSGAAGWGPKFQDRTTAVWKGD